VPHWKNHPVPCRRVRCCHWLLVVAWRR
jgi:hypothetical protein